MLQLVDMVNNYKNETQGRLEDPQTLTRKYKIQKYRKVSLAQKKFYI